MSSSLQGVLVDREFILGLRPDNHLVSEVVVRLVAMLDRFYPYEMDREDYVEPFTVAVDYLRYGGPHPGPTPEGAFLTETLLELLGERVHSNAFNPISWTGVQAMHDTLAAAGSPVELVNREKGNGPWGLSDLDSYFIGGWDQPALRALGNSITSASQNADSATLRAFGLWVDTALESERTIWAWHSG